MEPSDNLCLYHLGQTTWRDTQAIVCSLARLGRQAIVLSYSASPCLCVGAQVSVNQVVDQEFCYGNDIPVCIRETRSSNICLAKSQIELQIVLSRKNSLVLGHPADRCHAVLAPLFDTCRSLVLDPLYSTPYEITVGGRRIASGCAAEIHQQVVLAANLTLDFDAELFADALNVPSPELRTRLVELARARRTSLREELGRIPSENILEGLVCEHLQPVVGVPPRAQVDSALYNQMREHASMFSPARAQVGPAQTGWKVDIGAGATLQQSAYKAPGGFLRATCEWQDDRIVRACLRGEFFSYPPGALYRLEQALIGVRADQVSAKINEFYGRLGLVTPGIQAAHWAKVLMPSAITER